MRYRFQPAIFASAPLDKRDWRWHLTSAFSQRLQKYTVMAVHTKTHRRRFQIYPLWRACFNICVYGERFHRLRVDGRPKRIKKFAFTTRWSGDVMKRPGHRNFISQTRAAWGVVFEFKTLQSQSRILSVVLELLLSAFGNRKCGRHGEWSVTFWQWNTAGVKELDAFGRWCWKSQLIGHAVEL